MGFLGILQAMRHQVIFITGVSGSGKTSVGTAVAAKLGIPFYDGDDFHPAANKAKMGAGHPLTDADRLPWLAEINRFAREHLAAGSMVIACSALKETYRDLLESGLEQQVRWFHLQGPFSLIHDRMEARQGHYMKADMLRSQFETYEPPIKGVVIPIHQSIDSITEQIVHMSTLSSVGLIGMGVMGTSLARNIADKGFSLSVFNRYVQGKEEGVAMRAVARFPELRDAHAFEDIRAFVESLARPRQIIMMVNAGAAVDAVITELLPLLSPGDVLADGGNSYYKDTVRREKLLKDHGMHFVGAGISGGEEGALEGPAIMPGGSREGYQLLKPVLDAIAARNRKGEICCSYIGDEGAGHFVKMVHNGIEYAEMALISELFSFLRQDMRWTVEEIAILFSRWNSGDTASYLLEITIDILRYKDETGALLLDRIHDTAGSKGTGSWTSIAAAELGVAVPSLTAALYARYISAQYESRQAYASKYTEETDPLTVDTGALQRAYQFCRLMHHQQGFALMRAASEAYGWQVDLQQLLTVWSGGCIIRSSLLDLLKEGWADAGGDVMLHGYTRALVAGYGSSIREVIHAVQGGHTACPVLTAGWEYFRQFTEARSNAYLIQAQRDYFGAHTVVFSADPMQIPRHVDWKRNGG